MWCIWVALNQRGSRLTLLSRYYMILGQTSAGDSPRIDKFKSYKLTSCIELFYSLTGPQNLKCYCTSLKCDWSTFGFFSYSFPTWHAVFWYPRLLANMTALLTEAPVFHAGIRHSLISPFTSHLRRATVSSFWELVLCQAVRLVWVLGQNTSINFDFFTCG